MRTQFRVIVALATAFAGIAVGYTPAVAADASTIRINEVESNGGTPGDWVELVNTGTTAVDVSGWVVKDNDDTHVFTIAAGTSIGAAATWPSTSTRCSGSAARTRRDCSPPTV